MSKPKAQNVADLLYAFGWRSPLDAQHDELTRLVRDGSLLAALVEDIKHLAVEDNRE